MPRKKSDPEKRIEKRMRGLEKLKETKAEYHILADANGRNLYPGVFFSESTKHSRTGKAERVFYIRYRTGVGASSRLRFERCGCQCRDRMTPAKAAAIRQNRLAGKEPPNSVRREVAKAEKSARANRMTFDKLWEKWQADPENAGKRGTLKANLRYRKHIKEVFGSREPKDLKPFDIDRHRLTLARTYSRETVKSILGLITRIARYGASKGLCAGLSFPVILKGKTLGKEPKIKAAPSDEQFDSFVKTCEAWPDIQMGNFMLFVAFTGIRRGSVRNLKWNDIDYNNRTAVLRDSKTGNLQVTLSDDAVALLRNHPVTEGVEFVFSGAGPGGSVALRTLNTHPRLIADAAGLPKELDPCHGFRRRLATKVEGKYGVATAMRAGGWKTPAMVLHYTSVGQDTIRDAVNLLGRNIPEVPGENIPDAPGENIPEDAVGE